MRIVVKVGTSTLAHAGGRLNIRHVEELVKVLSDLKNAGHEMIVVSSGAIGMGAGKLGLSRPKDMPTKQAAASVGQCELMYTYDTPLLWVLRAAICPMGRKMAVRFLSGASFVRLASLGSSMLTESRSASSPRRSTNCGSAPGMVLAWMYPLKRYSSRSRRSVSIIRSMVASGLPTTALDRNSPSI